MKNKAFRLFYCLSLFGIFLASLYPLIMGVRVVRDMIVQGTVMGKDYPKYIIPYLPIALSVIAGVAIMPLLFRMVRKYALTVASAVGLGVFFASELVLENWVIVTDTVMTTLESWQMFMCYVPPEMFETRTWRAIDVLIGEYSPWFKLHFYIIAIVLILTFLNCFYGFGQMIVSGRRERMRHLILQSVASVLFLGLCILACFTAFWRTGEITVSPLSAFLMCLFFIVFGVTMGLFTASFLTKRPSSAVLSVSAAVSSVVTLIMYIGELILLSGHLYRFGNGFLFDGLGALVLAPIDLIVILLSGGITAVILKSVADDKK
jgi:hypothetical protein